MKRLLGTFGGLAALLLLAGCGIKTGLARPEPMWGSESAHQAEAQRQSEAAAARAERDARRTGASEPAPSTTTPAPATPPVSPP